MSSSTTPNSLASLGALITGGGSGIGLATARLLLEQLFRALSIQQGGAHHRS